MKKLLITGALGHIGSKFIREIKPGDFESVMLIDNLSTQRYSSLFHLPDGVPFKFSEADILQDGFEKYVKGMDIVLHLAAVTNAEESFQKQEKVEEVNYEGTKKLAEACLKSGCCMIFPSTTSVYGTQNERVDELCPDTDLKPQSPYAGSKLRAENFLKTMGQSSGLKYVVLRFGTIFGASTGMRFHTAINKFIWQACMGAPLTVWRTALNQKRPYLALPDATRALRFVMEKQLFNNEVYNVITVNATVAEIVDILRLSFPELTVNFVDSKIMNQLSYEVSCEKFKKHGFVFKYNLNQQIEETIHWLGSAVSLKDLKQHHR